MSILKPHRSFSFTSGNFDTTPTNSSTKYTGTDIAVNSTIMLKAIAVITGCTNSAVASAT